MISLALVGPITSPEMTYWDYVISNWGIDQVYVIGDAKLDSRPFKGAERLPCLGSLPESQSTILFAPKTGHRFQGDDPLTNFSHPLDAIYIFGSNHRHLTEDEMGGLIPTNRIFIPTESHHEMHSFVVAAIALYDRSVKSGKSDHR